MNSFEFEIDDADIEDDKIRVSVVTYLRLLEFSFCNNFVCVAILAFAVPILLNQPW